MVSVSGCVHLNPLEILLTLALLTHIPTGGFPTASQPAAHGWEAAGTNFYFNAAEFSSFSLFICPEI